MHRPLNLKKELLAVGLGLIVISVDTFCWFFLSWGVLSLTLWGYPELNTDMVRPYIGYVIFFTGLILLKYVVSHSLRAFHVMFRHFAD